MSKQIISYNNGLDVLCGMVVHDLTIGDAFSQSFAKLQFYPGTLADFTNANVIGLSYGPGISNTRTVYVDKGGNDLDGDGSVLNPFLTINVALSAIADASETKKYCIIIGPGVFTENIILKPNVSLIGTSILNSEIVGTVQISSDWASGNLESCLLQGLTFGVGSDLNFNYYGLSVTQSLIAIQNCVINGNLSCLAMSTQNLTVVRACVLLGNVQIVGGLFQSYGNFIPNNNLSVQTDVGRENQSILFGTVGFGNFTFLSPLGADQMNVIMLNSPCGSLTIDGSNVSCSANSASIPSIANTSILNSAVLNKSSDASCLGYTPTNPSDWVTVPSDVQQGLDYLALTTNNLNPLFESVTVANSGLTDKVLLVQPNEFVIDSVPSGNENFSIRLTSTSQPYVMNFTPNLIQIASNTNFTFNSGCVINGVPEPLSDNQASNKRYSDGYADDSSKPTITFSAGTPGSVDLVTGNRNHFKLSVTTGGSIGVGAFPLCYINHADYVSGTISQMTLASFSCVRINQLAASPSGWYVIQFNPGELQLWYGVSTDIQINTTYEFNFDVRIPY